MADLVDRRTGKLVAIPDAKVQEAFKSGMYGLPKGAAVPVVTESGVVGELTPEQAAVGFERGNRIASPDEMHKARMEARYGGVANTYGAYATGVTRGLADTAFLPFDQMALGAYGLVNDGNADPLRERLNAYKEMHPYASGIGEAVGITAGTVLQGGAGGGARVGLSGLGHAAESLAPRALGGVGKMALRGAAEGAALGGVDSLNEAALGDHHLNGEKIIAGIGHGAILGGAGGAALGALGLLAGTAKTTATEAIERMRPADLEALVEKQVGYVPEGLGEKLRQHYIKAASIASGKDPEVIAKLTQLGSEGAEARRVAVFDAPKIQDEATRALRTEGDNLLSAGSLVSDEARGTLKADHVRKSVLTGNETQVRERLQDQVNKLLDGAQAQLDGDLAPQMTKSVETVSKAAYKLQDAVSKGASNAELFVELDSLKRSMQKLTSTGYRSSRNIADPLEQLAARNQVQWLDNSAAELRGVLEEPALWGRAADQQKAINEAWTRQIDASGRFHKALTTEVGRDPKNPYLKAVGIDPAKAESYVKSLVNPNQDLTHQAVKDYLRSTQDLAEAIKTSYDLPADKLAEVERVHAAAKSFDSSLQKGEKALVLANQYRSLTEGGGDGLGSLLGTIGLGVGGLPGGILGTAVGAVANPGRTVAQLAAVERLATKMDVKIGSAVRNFFKAGGGPYRGSSLPVGDFEGAVKEISHAAASPEMQQAKIAAALGGLGEAAPNTTTSATMVASNITSFLASKIPVGMANQADMFPGEQPPLVSDTEKETFLRYVAAARDPVKVLEHLKSGSVSPEEAEALKHCYPRIYADVQNGIYQAISSGKTIPYEKRVSLGTLFNVPTDSSMTPQVMQAVSGARKRGGGHKEDKPPTFKPMHIASSFSTSFDTARGGRFK